MSGSLARGSEASVVAAAERGLDWLNLFVGNIQTGFGPFIAAYLTSEGWTQTAIGFALSLGTATAMAGQIPAGWLVDALPSKSRVAAFSILAFTLCALLLGALPRPIYVYFAEMLHGFASCTLAPAIAALSLAIAGQAGAGRRLGRNARYASIGTGIGAALMGASAFYVSERAVFFLTAALTLPALAAIMPLARFDEGMPRLRKRTPRHAPPRQPLRLVLKQRGLLIFAIAAMLFTLGNAAMLPMIAGALTRRAGSESSLLIAASIVLPQIVVALLSPAIGGLAERWGRRPILLLGFAAPPLRGALFAGITDPTLVVLIQALDGIAGASFGVMVPLVTADIARRFGRFNLTLGIVGLAIGIGGMLSTTLAGAVADRLGDSAAFLGLALIGLAALLLVWCAMPETRKEASERG